MPVLNIPRPPRHLPAIALFSLALLAQAPSAAPARAADRARALIHQS